LTHYNSVGLHYRMTEELHAADGDDRNRQPRGDRRRQQILDAAVELFAAKGYRGTGVVQLAKRVGMTDTGVLYYFGSKDRLLREVVAERQPYPFPNVDDGVTLRQLRDVGRHGAQTPLLVRLFAVLGAESLNPDEPLHDYFVRRYDAGRAFARRVLEADRDRDLIRDDIDIDQIATEIIAVGLGMEIMWLADPDSIDLAAAGEAFIDRLVDELAPRDHEA
jgi:AcrR family transcriptional regulator